MPDQFIIPRDLLEGVVRYLQTRPYAEVFQAVPALQGLRPAPVTGADQGGCEPSLAADNLHA